jgi:hypothetical protein
VRQGGCSATATNPDGGLNGQTTQTTITNLTDGPIGVSGPEVAIFTTYDPAIAHYVTVPEAAA